MRKRWKRVDIFVGNNGTGILSVKDLMTLQLHNEALLGVLALTTFCGVTQYKYDVPQVYVCIYPYVYIETLISRISLDTYRSEVSDTIQLLCSLSAVLRPVTSIEQNNGLRQNSEAHIFVTRGPMNITERRCPVVSPPASSSEVTGF
jgi:hypothetical protein